MKVSVNGQELYNLTATQLKILADEISTDDLDANLKRRITYFIDREFALCFSQFKKDTLKFLQDKNIETAPADPEEYCQLVFGQDEFKNVPECDDFVTSVDDIQLHVLSGTKCKLICHVLKKDAHKRLREIVEYFVPHKLEKVAERLRRQWDPRLQAKGINDIPVSDEAFAQLVFSQPEYEDRKARKAQETLI